MLVTHGAEVSDLHVVMSSDMTQRRHLCIRLYDYGFRSVGFLSFLPLCFSSTPYCVTCRGSCECE